MEEMSDSNLLACPRMVYAELLDGQDDVADWAQKREEAGMFMDPDAVVQLEFQRVCTYTINRYPDNLSRRRFLGRADPWIIAHAIAKGGTVVTHEERIREESSKVKIPNVCGHFNVRCINVYQMLRDQGVSWTR